MPSQLACIPPATLQTSGRHTRLVEAATAVGLAMACTSAERNLNGPPAHYMMLIRTQLHAPGLLRNLIRHTCGTIAVSAVVVPSEAVAMWQWHAAVLLDHPQPAT